MWAERRGWDKPLALPCRTGSSEKGADGKPGLIAEGRPEVPIAKSYSLAEEQEACRELEQRHTLGRIVLHP